MTTDQCGKAARHVLLTGAFGGVGEWLIPELLALGFSITCFDRPIPANHKKAARLRRLYNFAIQWGDLTLERTVRTIVETVRPDIIVHAAAIIPPLSFKNPALAEAVNVGGTQALIASAEAVGTVSRFILVSSYSVCGPVNPHRDPPLWTSATPTAPQDDYARQKVVAETMLRDSQLEWSIVRLCAVFPLSAGTPDPDTLSFSFCLPFDRREHAIDVRDAALAIARSAQVRAAAGRTFTVGGGEGWHGLGGDLTGALMRASGLRPFPRHLFREPDPDVDSSWFYENWVDTTESEEVLRYQRHSFDDYLHERRRRMGLLRYVLPLFAGLIYRSLAKKSPYFGKSPKVDSRPFADSAREAIDALET